MLARHGIPARIVGTVSLDDPNGRDDGHMMLEALVRGRFQVFDLDRNVQPVNRRGEGVSIHRLVAQRRRYVLVLARDRKVQAGLLRWYKRMFGVAYIFDGVDYWTSTDAAGAAQFERFVWGAVNLSRRDWRTRFYLAHP